MIIPSYLKPGDTIGIVCPAGSMPFEKARVCIDTLKEWGYNVRIGKTLGSSFHYFSASDEDRRHDLQQMLDDSHIHAILCGRGGYGLSRIIDKLDFSAFKKNPKWIIGFSDITLLHAHINNVLNTASLHAPMAAAFNDGENEYIQSLHDALTGEMYEYFCSAHSMNKKGSASGKLIGGNLALLAHNVGSISDYTSTENFILYIEDVGEVLYNIDRMMMQLKRSGKLDKLSALVVGGFTDMKDTTVPFGESIEELILDKVKEYNYPVCFGFPVGHQKENYALKNGLLHELVVDESGVVLKEA